MDTRRCPRCERELPVERFGKNSRSADGLMTACRECVNTDLRAYRSRDGRAAANRHSRDWAARNREKTHIAQARWRERHREYKRQYDKARYPQIRAAQRERQRAREAADPKLRERRLKLAKANRQKNRERIRARERERYRATHPPKPPLSLRERFEALVERGGATGSCWKWLGYSNGGYPRFEHQGKAIVAARLAYALYIGPLAAKRKLRHTCGDVACVNPAHLRPLGV